MEVLKNAGLIVETLTDFAQNFNVTIGLELNDVIVAHMNEIERNHIIQEAMLIAEDCDSVKNVHFGKVNENALFDAHIICFELSKSFKSNFLTNYLMQSCYLFVTYGFNTLEPILLYPNLQSTLSDVSRRLRDKKAIKRVSDKDLAHRLLTWDDECHEPPAKKLRSESPDMYEDSFKIASEIRNVPGLKKPRLIKKKNLVWEESVVKRSSTNPFHEEVCLNPMLYDMKQRTYWPELHPLSNSNAGSLLQAIVALPVKGDACCLDEWKQASLSWEELHVILQHFTKNERKLSRNNGYHRILLHHLSNECKSADGECVMPVPKTIVTNYICDILRRVISSQLFYESKSRIKKFLSSISKFATSIKHQKFLLGSFAQHIPEESSWRNQINSNFRDQITVKIIKFILIDYVSFILRSEFFITETSTTNYELHYYLKHDIDRVTTSFVNHMIHENKLELLNSCQRDSDNDTCCIEYCSCHSRSAKVRLLPKAPNFKNIRLITKKTADHCAEHFQESKLLLECILSVNGTGIKPVPSDCHLNAAWKRIVDMKDEHAGVPLYYVKGDITDAFGSVNHQKLFEILDNIMPDSKNSVLTLLTIYEWVVKDGNIVRKERRSFSRKVQQNRLLCSRSGHLGDRKVLELKAAIKQIVQYQQIKLSGKTYRLKVGLCQGGAGVLSPSLCDLYYSAMDRECFERFRTNAECVFIRAVDDYLLATTSRKLAALFLQKISSGIPEYNAKFNVEKLETNLHSSNNAFTYLGLVFDVDTMLVQPSYKRSVNALHSIKLQDISGNMHFKKEAFIFIKLRQLSSLKLFGIVYMNKHNTVAHLRKVICNACCLHLAKALELALFTRPLSLNLFVSLYKVCQRISRTVQRNFYSISENEVRYMYWNVALNVFKRNSGSFPSFLNLVKEQILRIKNQFQRNNGNFILNLLNEDVSGIFRT